MRKQNRTFFFNGRHAKAIALCLTLCMALVISVGCSSATKGGGGGSGGGITYAVGNSGGTASQLPSDPATYKAGDTVTVLGRGSLPADMDPVAGTPGKYFIGWSKTAPATGASFADLARSVDCIPDEHIAFSAATTLNAVYVSVELGNASDKVYGITASENTPAGAALADANILFMKYESGQKVATGQTVRPFVPSGYSIIGYVHKGWSFNAAAAATAAAPTLAVANDASKTAFVANAIWAPLTISKITYDKNSASGNAPMAPGSFTWPTAITLPASTGMTAPDGKTFAGWALSVADATAGTVISDADTVTAGTQWKPTSMPIEANPAGEVTLYASWVTTPVVTVSFNINGGSGTAPAAMTLTWPTPITLPPVGTMVAPTGLVFKGWALTASSVDIVPDSDEGTNGTQWKPATMPASGPSTQTLYAVWETNITAVITISFNANGGVTDPAGTSITWPAYTTLPGIGTMTVPTDKVFAGWALTASGSAVDDMDPGTLGTQWRPASKPLVTSTTVTFYAVWVNPVVNITYRVNGGSGTAPTAPAKLTWPTAVTLPDSSGMTPPTNKHFTGWSLTATGDVVPDADNVASGLQWKPAAKPLTPESNQVLFAVWADQLVYISFDLNTGTGTAPTRATLTWPNPIPLPGIGSMLPPTGKALKGWALSVADATSGTNIVAPGTLWKPATAVDTPLYACWADPVILVTYDKGTGGGTAPAAGQFNYTATAYLTLPQQGSMTVPSSGQEFKGWAISSSAAGLGTVVSDMDGATDGTQWRPAIAPVTTPTTQTFYAVWGSIVPYIVTIVYNNNGGSGTIANGSFAWPSTTTLSDGTGFTPPLDKVFAGWSETATGPAVTDRDTTMAGIQYGYTDKPANPTSTQNLYAVWVFPTISVTYDINGGLGTLPATTATLTWPTPLTLPGVGSMITPDTDKVFKGWADSPVNAGSGMVITDAVPASANTIEWKPAKPTTVTSTQILYAVWAYPVVSFTWNLAGGSYPSGTVLPANLIWPAYATIPDGTLMTAPADKIFKGWALSAADVTSGTIIADMDAATGFQWKPGTKPATANTNQTIYAVWVTPVVTIAFDRNTGSGTIPASITLTWPTAVLLPEGSVITPPTGKVFAGWALSTDDATTGTIVSDADPVLAGIQWKPASKPTTETSTVTLWATWVPATINVTYDANTGTTPPTAPASFVWPNFLTLPEQGTMVAPTGKVFGGWAVSQAEANAFNNIQDMDSSAAATGIQWKPASPPPTSSVTLYAVWNTRVTIYFSRSPNNGYPQPTLIWVNLTLKVPGCTVDNIKLVKSGATNATPFKLTPGFPGHEDFYSMEAGGSTGFDPFVLNATYTLTITKKGYDIPSVTLTITAGP